MHRLASLHRCMLRWGIGVAGAEGCSEISKASPLVINTVNAPMLPLIPSVQPVLILIFHPGKHTLWMMLWWIDRCSSLKCRCSKAFPLVSICTAELGRNLGIGASDALRLHRRLGIGLTDASEFAVFLLNWLWSWFFLQFFFLPSIFLNSLSCLELSLSKCARFLGSTQFG